MRFPTCRMLSGVSENTQMHVFFLLLFCAVHFSHSPSGEKLTSSMLTALYLCDAAEYPPGNSESNNQKPDAGDHGKSPTIAAPEKGTQDGNVAKRSQVQKSQILPENSSPNNRLADAFNIPSNVIMDKANLERTWGTLLQSIRGRLWDENTLAQIALENPDPSIRSQSVDMITSQAILIQIAWEVQYTDTGMVAVRKISDQDVLARIVLEHKNVSICVEALTRLVDQSQLADIVLLHKNIAVCKVALSRIEDPGLLLALALYSHDLYICIAAIERINDQEFLAIIVRKQENSIVRRAAVIRLTDQAFLEEIVRSDKDTDVRKAAVERLTDQARLEKIAMNIEYPAEIRIVAVHKITNQNSLVFIVSNSTDRAIVHAALERIPKLPAITIDMSDPEIQKSPEKPEIQKSMKKHPVGTSRQCDICGKPAIGLCSRRNRWVCNEHRVYTEGNKRIICP